MRNKLYTTGAAILTAAALGLASPAWAQTYDGGGSAAPAQTDFSDSTLQSYAVAAAAVQDAQQEWVPRIQNAESAAQKQQLREQATDEMIQAIRNQGLSVEEYNAITEAARSEPQLLRRIQEHMQN